MFEKFIPPQSIQSIQSNVPLCIVTGCRNKIVSPASNICCIEHLRSKSINYKVSVIGEGNFSINGTNFIARRGKENDLLISGKRDGLITENDLPDIIRIGIPMIGSIKIEKGKLRCYALFQTRKRN